MKQAKASHQLPIKGSCRLVAAISQVKGIVVGVGSLSLNVGRVAVLNQEMMD